MGHLDESAKHRAMLVSMLLIVHEFVEALTAKVSPVQKPRTAGKKKV